MLLGTKEFCSQARSWLRRFGGNLYTLLPYAISGWAGYKKHVMGVNRQMTFVQKKEKMVNLVSMLTMMEQIKSSVSFDPEVPQTNMVHGYLRASVQDCIDARDEVERRTGICVLNRVREVDQVEHAFELGYRAKFEWAIGDANGSLEDDIFLRGWRDFALELLGRDKNM